MSNEKIEKMLYDAKEKLPTTNAEWRVSDMAEKNVKKNRFRINKAVAAAGLVLLISFATGNVVTFAMTGNSLIKTATNAYALWTTDGVEREQVVLNGNLAEIIESVKKGEVPSQEVEGSAVTITNRYFEYREATEYMDAHEMIMFDFEYNGQQSGLGFNASRDNTNYSVIAYVTEGPIGSVSYDCEVFEENGRIYLQIVHEKIDITYDFKDGKASGEFIDTWGFEGKKLSYTVEGDLEEYKTEIKLVIEEY